MPYLSKHLIKKKEDYKIIGEIFEGLVVEPQPQNYADLCKWVGPQGHPAIFCHLAASGVQAVLRDLMDPTKFFLELVDHPAQIEKLGEVIEPVLMRVLKTCLDTAENPMVLFGGNFDSMLTYPPFFKEHILPSLNRACDKIHQAGGFALIHADGENDELLSLYRKSGVDVFEAVNVSPAANNTYREIRDRLLPNQILFGGIPSTILRQGSFSDAQFEEFLAQLGDAYHPDDRLILGVSDNVPPDADIERLRRVGDFARNLG